VPSALRKNPVPAMRIEREAEIGRPVDDVWAFISDARNDPQWCSKVLSVEQVAGDGPGPDARYVATHRPVRLRGATELSMDVVEFQPLRRLRWREEDGDATFDVTYELDPIGDKRMRLRQIDEIDWKLPRVGQAIGRITVGRHIGQQLQTLKRLMEAG
jgi:uncharacterized membrane protein